MSTIDAQIRRRVAEVVFVTSSSYAFLKIEQTCVNAVRGT